MWDDIFPAPNKHRMQLNNVLNNFKPVGKLLIHILKSCFFELDLSKSGCIDRLFLHAVAHQCVNWFSSFPPSIPHFHELMHSAVSYQFMQQQRSVFVVDSLNISSTVLSIHHFQINSCNSVVSPISVTMLSRRNATQTWCHSEPRLIVNFMHKYSQQISI